MCARLLLFLTLAACREAPPDIPLSEGGLRRDGGRIDARIPPRRDAGPTGPTVDGVLDEDRDEWEGAASAELDREPDREGSVLTRLFALLADDRLYLGVEGSIAKGDAIAIYVDRDLGGSAGLVDPSELADAEGRLDVALARSALDVPEGFAMDYAWGTTAMPFTGVGLDEAIGWREVAADPEAFVWIASEQAPSVCGEGFCETFIPLETLGGEAPRTLAIFARIIASEGSFTNQTLPEDDGEAPEVVRALLTIDDGEIERDAGVPDAGADAGPGGIVIDGSIGESEWLGATPVESSTVAAGSFAGNALRSLRAVRTETDLFLAIEGALMSANAITVYVDRDVEGPDGIVSPTPLDDLAGALDRALSKELFTPAELRLDFAWGTLDMDRSTGVIDDRMGWRDIATDPAAFAALAAPSACSEEACETRISLGALGASEDDDLGIFVRLVAATSLAVSNQTLPMDDPFAPELVTTFVRLPAP